MAVAKRLTQRDWQVIRHALRAMQAGDYPGEIGLSEEQADLFWADLEDAIEKVWDRVGTAEARWEKGLSDA